MIDLMLCRLTNLLFLDISSLYCYTNLNSSIICCLSPGDMCNFFSASISSFCYSLECNSVGDFLEGVVILSAILLPIKSPVASAVFWIALFKAVFIASVVDFLTFLTVFLA